MSIDVPKAAGEDWPGFVKLVSRMRKAKTTWLAEFEAVRQWYEPHLQRMYDDSHLRAADIAQLEQLRPDTKRGSGFSPRSPSIRLMRRVAALARVPSMKIKRSCPPAIPPRGRNGGLSGS